MQLHQAAHGVEAKDQELSAKDKQSHQATHADEVKDQTDNEVSNVLVEVEDSSDDVAQDENLLDNDGKI